MMRWSPLHGDMQGRRGADKARCPLGNSTGVTRVRSKRNSLSGKYHLPCRPARGGETPAHIGEALLLRQWVIPREVLGKALVTP
jgi:hypothetical protein